MPPQVMGWPKPMTAWAALYRDQCKIREGLKTTAGGAVWLDTPTELKIYKTRKQARRHAGGRIIKVRITPIKS